MAIAPKKAAIVNMIISVVIYFELNLIGQY